MFGCGRHTVRFRCGYTQTYRFAAQIMAGKAIDQSRDEWRGNPLTREHDSGGADRYL
jgi:hypothetical protein